MNRFVFLDLETTGLEFGVDQITEAAWITDAGEEAQTFVSHTRLPHEWVLQNTDYLSRVVCGSPRLHPAQLCESLVRTCNRMRVSDSHVYLVGANPAFDDRFLRDVFREWCADEIPYHYHLVDVEAMAMGMFGLDAPPRLKEIRALLGIPGANPAAHTALSDAREVEIVFNAMRQHAKKVAA